ncbi:FeoA family protein [Okeania sp.]|uniref:FeoA family protein n=1 Tax=Okeania sp. TaxID=3100323 RepID=UPI002B4B45F2|nr:FeoA family protein [Okeania sp.]MEB3343400.1 FeoA family protein [Okeania sp.]
MNLADLKIGETGIVKQVLEVGCQPGIVQRLTAMGIVSERPVQVLRKAIFNGPLHIRVGATTEIAIRLQEAEMIIIK